MKTSEFKVWNSGFGVCVRAPGEPAVGSDWHNAATQTGQFLLAYLEEREAQDSKTIKLTERTLEGKVEWLIQKVAELRGKLTGFQKAMNDIEALDALVRGLPDKDTMAAFDAWVRERLAALEAKVAGMEQGGKPTMVPREEMESPKAYRGGNGTVGTWKRSRYRTWRDA